MDLHLGRAGQGADLSIPADHSVTCVTRDITSRLGGRIASLSLASKSRGVQAR